MRPILLMVLLLILATSAHAAPQPLLLTATTVRSEFVAGDRFTVGAYLFNDSATPRIASIGIQAPAGFDLIRVSPTYTVTPTIAPGRATQTNWTYRVRADAPKGLARFVVVAFDDAALPIMGLVVGVTIRIGPVIAPPARVPPPRPVRLPIIMH